MCVRESCVEQVGVMYMYIGVQCLDPEVHVRSVAILLRTSSDFAVVFSGHCLVVASQRDRQLFTALRFCYLPQLLECIYHPFSWASLTSLGIALVWILSL